MVSATKTSGQDPNRVMAKSVFNLMRRLPPNQVAKSLAGIGGLIEDEAFKQQIFDQVDQPLEVASDESNGFKYLKHEYNRDGDSYRSHHTNTYYPRSTDCTFFPSDNLLQLEVRANELFATYVHLYYDDAISSVYFNDTETQGFNACFLVKKEIVGEKDVKSGCWDAIHVVACNMKEAPKVSYRVISTVMVTVDGESAVIGKMDIAGSSAKSAQETHNLPEDLGPENDIEGFHLQIIGKMIEANEETLRNNVQESYITKQRQITNTGRLLEEYMNASEKKAMQDELGEVTAKIAAKRSQESGEVFK